MLMMGVVASRYQLHHKFGKHIDESNQVGNAWTKFTLLVYLSGLGTSKQSEQPQYAKASSRIKGGETLFYGEGPLFLLCLRCISENDIMPGCLSNNPVEPES